jgi:tRNA(fMet)-specific endonuclease VapC
MICVDSSFLIDLLQGDEAASSKSKQLEREQVRVATPALCLAEVLRGAYLLGGKELEKTRRVLSAIEILPLDGPVGELAGQLSAECMRRGRQVALLDCVIAATAIANRTTLLTRDSDFARIPTLQVETY